MAYPMDCVARLTCLMGSSLTMLFYGPILGTVVLATAFAYARVVIATRRRNTTRPRPRKRSGSGTSTPVFVRRGLSCRAASAAAGVRSYRGRS